LVKGKLFLGSLSIPALPFSCQGESRRTLLYIIFRTVEKACPAREHSQNPL
jgi:hypothetical protein